MSEGFKQPKININDFDVNYLGFQHKEEEIIYIPIRVLQTMQDKKIPYFDFGKYNEYEIRNVFDYSYLNWALHNVKQLTSVQIEAIKMQIEMVAWIQKKWS